VVRGPAEVDGVLRVPPRDTAALTDALGRILSDPVLAGRLSVAGRALAASQSWDAIAAVHAEVYAGALASRRGGRPWTAAAESRKVGAAAVVEGEADVTS
jgi:hypothetical protein